MNSPLPSPDFFGQGLPSGELFHYTSVTGITGVIEGRKLWATNIEYLNDSSEFTHGDGFMQCAIQARQDSNNPGESEFFEWLKGMPDSVQPCDVFVASLSEAEDLLSQWRGYTPLSSGFSVGFEPATLRDFAWNNHHAMLAQCVYEESEKQALANHILNTFLEDWIASQTTDSSGTWFTPGIAASFRTRAKLAAAVIKDVAFKEEKEWRLVKVCSDVRAIKFRPGVSTVVPYVELDWLGKAEQPVVQPIQSVMIGPCAHPELSKKSVTRLLQANGAGNASVRLSGIPFRSW